MWCVRWPLVHIIWSMVRRAGERRGKAYLSCQCNNTITHTTFTKVLSMGGGAIRPSWVLVCNRKKPDWCESVGDRKDKEKVFVCVDNPAPACSESCVCVGLYDGPGAADSGNAVQLIPEESTALQRRCLADLPSSVWLLLAAGVEKKSGTGSESESAVFNLRGTFRAEGRNWAEITSTKAYRDVCCPSSANCMPLEWP